jgi:hypothetical protein
MPKKKVIATFRTPEQPVTNFNGDGGEHSQSEKRRVEGHGVVKTPKELVSCHINASIPEQSLTNFNGDGGEHSHPEKRRVEGDRVVKTPKELVSCHIYASLSIA